MHIKMENIANVPIGEIFFPTITIPITKAKQFFNIQMEHSHLIINFNVTQKRKKEYFDWAPYNNNVFDLLDIYPNLTYFQISK
jgi:hypothetical protein